MAAIVLGKLVALVNTDAAVSGHEVFVVHDGRQQFVGVGISRHTALANVNASGSHMEEVIDYAGADKSIAIPIKVNAPWIASALGEYFEFLGIRMVARDRGRNFDAGRRGFGDFNLRMREHAMSHVKPAIGTPGESVEQFVSIVETEAVEQNGSCVCDVIVVCVLEK